MTEQAAGSKKAGGMIWLIYVALILAGVLFVADAFNISHLDRWTARLGIALLFSALALIIGNGRKTGYVAATIVWLPTVVPLIYGLFN